MDDSQITLEFPVLISSCSPSTFREKSKIGMCVGQHCLLPQRPFIPSYAVVVLCSVVLCCV